MHQTFRSASMIALTMLAAACTPSPRHFGDIALPSSLAAPTHPAFASGGHSAADLAVRQALLSAGWREEAKAGVIVEAGYAVRAPRLAVTGPDKAPVSSASSAHARSPSFCRRQAHVLTLAFVDPASGKVIGRSGARVDRCGARGDDLLPMLAAAAIPLSPPRQPEAAERTASR